MSDTPNATNQALSFSPVLKAFKDAAGSFQIGASARDYVERTAGRAQETLTGIHDNAASVSRSLEAAAVQSVETYANVTRNVAELAFRNAQAQLGLVQKLAGVTSLEQAISVYAEYAKNASETNLAAMRGAAEYVKERVTEGATNARDNLAKAFPRAA